MLKRFSIAAAALGAVAVAIAVRARRIGRNAAAARAASPAEVC
jgi:hypothetical protein